MYFFLPFLISSASAGISTVCHLLCPSLGKMFPWYLQSQCLWTMVLEKTPESSLDSKELKLVNLKGNQAWILIGRTDAEVEAPVFWSSDVNRWLIGKVPDAGKDWRQEKRASEDEMAGKHHWCNEHELGQTPDTVKDREAWRAAVHGVTESDTTEVT